MTYAYARRMAHLRASEIRELLKLTESPDIISFAGGLPAPELFPVEEIIEAAVSVLREDGGAALQYTTTEGYAPLRAWIADRVNKTRGTNLRADNILLTNGSQQALDLTGKVFIDEGRYRPVREPHIPGRHQRVPGIRVYVSRGADGRGWHDPGGAGGDTVGHRTRQAHLCHPGFPEPDGEVVAPGAAAVPLRAGRTVRRRRYRG